MKNKIILLASLVFMSSFSSVSYADVIKSEENIVISRVNDYVNIREKANTRSKVLGKIHNNCAATVLETVSMSDGEWYKINSGAVNGYIKAEYFISGEEAKEIAKGVSTTHATITGAGSLRLREKADPNSKILTVLSEGTSYEVIGFEGNFAKLQVDADLSGYVSKDYITTEISFDRAVSLEAESANTKEKENLKKEAINALNNLEKLKKENNISLVSGTQIELVPKKEESPDMPKDNISLSSKAIIDNITGVGPVTSDNLHEEFKNNIKTATKEALIAYAKQFLGNPYRFGGTSLTQGADCSGFTMKVFENFGYSIGRSSRDQANIGKEVSKEDMQVGDLLFYASGDYINHVAIYIGDGKVIHSSTPKTGITIAPANYRTPVKIKRVIE